MTEAIVVDASTALKWVLDEEHSDAARALLDDALTGRGSLAAPALLAGEATNALYQRQRRKLLTRGEADRALATLLASPIRFVDLDNLHTRAMTLAQEHALPSTYDAQYLVVARALGAEFWTADVRLYNAVSRSLRWVRRISDYGT